MKKTKKRKQINAISRQTNTMLNVIFIIWSMLCIFPFLLVLGISFSSESSLVTVGYRILPPEFSISAYDYLFQKSTMLLRAYVISIGVTVCGTILTLIITAMFAYPLSRKYFKYRSIFAFLIFFSMIFNGGMVASYMVYTQVLGLKNHLFAYIMPYLLSGWNVIMLRTFITGSVPDDLVDAAKIDGAGEATTFTRIVLPLCKPGLATIGLFTAIGMWNDWYTPSLYIKESKLFNLQYLLCSMLSNIQFLKTNIGKIGSSALALAEMPSEGIRMAMCIVTIAPIVLAYPFFQKYFVKGLTVGAVKG